MKVFLLALVFVFAYSQTVAPICSSDSDCNNYSTFNALLCENPGNVTTASCPSRTKFEFGTTNTNSKGMCTGSFNFGSGNTHICGQYATVGCTIDILNTRCIASNYNLLTKKCDALNNTLSVVEVDEGQRCETVATPYPVCKSNLKCVQKVCRPTLKAGENCYHSSSHPIGCGVGLVCDADVCVPKYSRVAQDPCKTSEVCAENVCNVGVCSERRSIPCYSNAECPSDARCYNGVCTRGRFLANRRYERCLFDRCSAVMSAADLVKCAYETCGALYVEKVCQEQCENREDLRTVTDGYIYDCKALTRTKIADNTCDVKSTVRNCNVPISGAFVQGLSFVVLALIAILFA